MVSVIPVNPGYHNNRNWALANKAKGKNATIYAVGATIAGCTKIFAEKDSITYTLLNFGHKTLEALRNLEQYLMYKRNDDDVAKDKATKPLAGTIGSIASNYETIINPVALPLSTFLNEKWGESYASIANWLSSFWWRFRLCFEKIDLKLLKRLPAKIKYLFSNDKGERNQTLLLIQNSLSPILGVLGSFFIGLFVPIRAWKKLTGNENKWLDACADSGMLTQHIRYLTKFTLEELFSAIDTKNKHSCFLFSLGIVTNLMNIGLPAIDLLPLNEKTKMMWKELAQGLARVFFSTRRNIKGNEWLEKNCDN